MRSLLWPVALLLFGVEPAVAQAAGVGQANQTARAQQSDQAQRERRICRSEVETGSLARRRRQCFTPAEWERIAAAARENAQYEMDRQRNRSSGE